MWFLFEEGKFLYVFHDKPTKWSIKKSNQIMHSQLINMRKILFLRIYIIYTYIYMPQNIYIDLV
jgi:hypothetical protein